MQCYRIRTNLISIAKEKKNALPDLSIVSLIFCYDAAAYMLNSILCPHKGKPVALRLHGDYFALRQIRLILL